MPNDNDNPVCFKAIKRIQVGALELSAHERRVLVGLLCEADDQRVDDSPTWFSVSSGRLAYRAGVGRGRLYDHLASMKAVGILEIRPSKDRRHPAMYRIPTSTWEAIFVPTFPGDLVLDARK